MEEWRNVPGFDGKYQVNIAAKEGKCRSTNYNKTGKPREMSQMPHNYGGGNPRILWHFRKDGVSYCKQAAYWIAITFPELVQNEYFDGAEIDHIDADPMNNQPSNLRWVTHKENMNNTCTRENLSKGKTGENNPNYKKVFSAEYRKKLSEGQKRRHRTKQNGSSR